MLFYQLKEKIGIKKFLHTIFFIPGILPILNKLTEYHFIRFSISIFGASFKLPLTESALQVIPNKFPARGG